MLLRPVNYVMPHYCLRADSYFLPCNLRCERQSVSEYTEGEGPGLLPGAHCLLRYGSPKGPRVGRADKNSFLLGRWQISSSIENTSRGSLHPAKGAEARQIFRDPAAGDCILGYATFASCCGKPICAPVVPIRAGQRDN